MLLSTLSLLDVIPTKPPLELVKQVLRYIEATMRFKLRSLLIYKSPVLNVFTDASWANDPNTTRLSSGYIPKMTDYLMSWLSRQQPNGCQINIQH